MARNAPPRYLARDLRAGAALRAPRTPNKETDT